MRNPEEWFAETWDDQTNQRGMPSFVPLKSKSFESYPIWGMAVPMKLQPSMIEGNATDPFIAVPGCDELRVPSITRIQQYSVNARTALGEYRMVDRFSKRAGSLHLSAIQENSHFDIEDCITRIKKFCEYAKLNTSELRTKGNTARIEICFQVPQNTDRYEVLQNAFYDMKSIVNRHATTYDATVVADYIDITHCAYQSRVHLLSNMMQANASTFSRNSEFYPLLRDLCKLIYSFYSGQGLLRDMHITSTKLAYCAERMVFVKSPPLMELTRRQIITALNTDWYEAFQLGMSINSKLGFASMQPTDEQRLLLPWHFPPPYHAGHACSKCMKIFYGATEHCFEDHACIEAVKGDKIMTNSPEFEALLGKFAGELKGAQVLPLQILEGETSNIFLTGPAGVGKSLALRVLIATIYFHFGTKGLGVCAPNKVAANIIDGKTLHSLLGVGAEDISNMNITHKIEDLRRYNPALLEFLRMICFLVLDECGMLSRPTFEKISDFFSELRGNTLPFGGLRVILAGDVCQSPPVCIGSPVSYFFQSPIFSAGGFSVIYLKKCYRQDDIEHIKLLHRLRDGKNYILNEDIHKLNFPEGCEVFQNSFLQVMQMRCDLIQQSTSKALVNEHHTRNRNELFLSNEGTQQAVKIAIDHGRHLRDSGNEKQDFFILTPRNIEVEYYERKLAEQCKTSDDDVFYAEDTYPADGLTEQGPKFVFPKEVILVRGMRVRFLSNQIHPLIAHNQLGVIEKIAPDCIWVRPDVSGCVSNLTKVVRLEEYVTHNSRLYKRRQYPLSPAFAANVPSVQGLTLNGIPTIFDNSTVSSKADKGIANGCGYTFVSRHSKQRYLFPLFAFVREDFTTNPDALAFDQFIRGNMDDEMNCITVITPKNMQLHTK